MANSSQVDSVLVLHPDDLMVIGLIGLVIAMAWAWGALLNEGLGLNRWFGLLFLIPGINIIAFIASGVMAHERIMDKADEEAFAAMHRLIAEKKAEAELRQKNMEENTLGT